MDKDDSCSSLKKLNSVTPISIRDVIVKCFLESHREDLDAEKYAYYAGEYSTNITDVKRLVRGIFLKVGGNYDRPNREDLILVVNELKNYSSHFKNNESVEKNYEKIVSLINQLKCD